MKIGQIVKDRYEILEILGEGGMAFVFKARDMQLERFVAIKTLKPNYVNQETFVDRFKREAKTAANLNHPNIVQIFDWGIEDEPYFVMEYIEGNTLTSIIAKKRTISLSDILFIGAQVSSGLHAAHQKGLVHRDIKPGNIMITPDGKVKVTDFGIVSLQNEESDITKTGSILGTASYISPEQAQGKPVSIESDLYSLGTVLYELITGKAPFSGDSPISTATKHLTEKPEKPSLFRRDLPKGVETAILKLLEKATYDRFKSAEDLRATLLQQRKALQSEQTRENLVDLTNPKVKLRFTLPALIVSIGVVFGTIWTLTQVFDGLPVDGGAPTLVEIPDLTGSEQAQALEDLQNLGFKVGIENSADASVPAGSVIRTQPSSNTVINPDSLVTIIVSVGPEAFPIPYILDIETERAIYVVEESGFTLGQLLEVNDENIPRGFVISQNPVAGTKMSPGSAVDLVVSKGPSLIEISDLSRKSPEDAIQILETLGFEYELIEEYSENVEVGLVSGTIPEAGEIVTPDEFIQVIVSLGIKIEVPEVEGLGYEDAINILEELGLVATVSGDTNGVVRKQMPRKGEFLEPEGVVELTFGN
ncbi:MAG: PASTA domain-containing protein [Actinomycetota bacterium]|jgi:serine/threonine-protein kinase|nr:PASTA domain-containing protein [Actinomycetota bacterium]MDA3008716.1 PASTA domain-containing protein [Actinomycetota bacterium]MDA3037876.1 PASTA domain-containing protein [Actinomycetota bacterium]